MLDREILKIQRGVSYGSVTLKSLQNENVPELDLLVREALQNSSDASLREPGPFYAVNFTTGSFCPAEFNDYMTDIKDYLNGCFPNDNAHFLEIRDTKTRGLTGPIRLSDVTKNKEDHGNFFKLVYDTGKRQTQVGAGGNWGFGKSVYYRVGIGIVIFYSRIKTDDGYESRLIITVVEDEGKTNADGSDATILNRFEPSSAGKAWWGVREGEDLLPLTDDKYEEFIVSLLTTFGLKPFKADETGTSVIIPYINPAKLLEDIVPADAVIEDGTRDHFETVWTSNLADYLKLAIQRWYAPKIHNRELPKFCDKKWLHVSVNNVPIRKQDMLPFFRLVQELYTTAIAKTYGAEYTSEWLPETKCLAVNIHNYFASGSTSGYVAALIITKDELNGAENVLSPYVYIGKFEAEGGKNEPIVMFAREPGMVIDYAVTGPWIKGISLPESQDEFVFAFYMPDTAKILKSDLPAPEYANMDLGAYLRACEASDHMGWDDPAKMQIVARIQKNTATQIENKVVSITEPRVEATASKLAVTLGRSLLPRVGYGKKKKAIGGGGGGRGGAMKNIEFEMASMSVSGNMIEIPFKLRLSHGKKAVNMELIVASEGGWIIPNAWQNDIGTSFPATISAFEIKTLASNIDHEPIQINDGCTAEKVRFECEKVSAELVSAEESHELTSVKINASILNMELIGTLRIKAYDKKYRFSIKIE